MKPIQQEYFEFNPIVLKNQDHLDRFSKSAVGHLQEKKVDIYNATSKLQPAKLLRVESD
jgi:hypothetical protein